MDVRSYFPLTFTRAVTDTVGPLPLTIRPSVTGSRKYTLLFICSSRGGVLLSHQCFLYILNDG